MNSLQLSECLDGCFCCSRWFVRQALVSYRLVVYADVLDGVVLSSPPFVLIDDSS